ncbi:aminodeoxychorismate synthase component I [Lactococcus cremoris]|uniref:Para-aminobenzoate synthase component I n=1 Tax=Lactococcus cremoris subsp. tructae TaxID=542833 RepID=A0A2A5SX42_LACLC|nr:aminodeoxychorismate synthase component I [Lactococcus cremoris]PCS20463.1 para-aminobenzoate synthase component I [Lactococcus cremoris subsp. tructae]
MKEFIKKNVDIWKIFLKYYRSDEEIVFLHTSQVNENEYYSILAHKPYKKVSKYQGELFVDGLKQNISFPEAVDLLRSSLDEKPKNWPINPEILGFVSYEQDPACFAAYDELLLFNHKTNILHVAQFGKTDGDYWLSETIDDETFNPEEFKENQGVAAVFIEQSHEEYIASIKKLQDYMVAGDIYVANLTQQFEIWSDEKPFDIFKKTKERIPAPFSSFLQYPEWKLTQISSSVERFVTIRDGALVSKPIKGTIARGENPLADELQKKRLSENEKERSELLMVTDLLRNDIARISEPFTLSVPKFAEIETFSHVHQLVTSITSKVKKDLTFSTFMTALFPGGSITGTPKKRALEIIKEVEKGPRGAYTGIQGWLNREMNLDMNIVIRTLVHDGETYQLGVGGGITFESDPEVEFEEILLKAKPFLQLFGIKEVPSSLFTTGLVKDGILLNMEGHVARLQKQYHHQDLEEKLKLFAQNVTDGVLRVSTDGDALASEIRPLPNSNELYRVKLSSFNDKASLLANFKLSGPDFQKVFRQEVLEAKKEGYQDVLFHINGFVSELSIGNFLAKRGDIYETPAKNALKGTYLDWFGQNYSLIYKDIAISDLKSYDAFYMTNAVRGLVEIEIDGIS